MKTLIAAAITALSLNAFAGTEIDFSCTPLDRSEVNKSKIDGTSGLEGQLFIDDSGRVSGQFNLKFTLRGNNQEEMDAGLVLFDKVRTESAGGFTAYIATDLSNENYIVTRAELLIAPVGKKLPTFFRTRIRVQLNENGPAHEFQTRCAAL